MRVFRLGANLQIFLTNAPPSPYPLPEGEEPKPQLIGEKTRPLNSPVIFPLQQAGWLKGQTLLSLMFQGGD